MPIVQAKFLTGVGLDCPLHPTRTGDEILFYEWANPSGPTVPAEFGANDATVGLPGPFPTTSEISQFLELRTLGPTSLGDSFEIPASAFNVKVTLLAWWWRGGTSGSNEVRIGWCSIGTGDPCAVDNEGLNFFRAPFISPALGIDIPTEPTRYSGRESRWGIPLTPALLNHEDFYIRFYPTNTGPSVVVNVRYIALEIEYELPSEEDRWSLTIQTNTAGDVDAGNTIAADPAPDMDGLYADRAVVEVEATTAIGYVYEGFSGDLTGMTNPQNITMDGNKTVTANFRQEVSLVVNENPDPAPTGGSFTLTPPGGDYLFGDTVVLAVTLPTGHHATLTVDTPSTVFVDQTGASTWNVTLVGDGEVTINYVPNTEALSVFSSGPGSIGFGITPADDTFTVGPNGNLTVPAVFGTNWTFLAAPSIGATFLGWSGSLSGTDNPETLAIAGPSVVIGVFTIEDITLTILIEGNGEVNATPPDQDVTVSGTEIEYNLNTVVTLTATPDSGWVFVRWEVDLIGAVNPGSVTMTEDKTVRAVFAEEGTPKVPSELRPPRNRWWTRLNGEDLYLRGT